MNTSKPYPQELPSGLKSPKPKPARASKKSPRPARRHGPVLLELTYALFVIIVIGVGLSIALLSWLAGADLLMIVVRTGSAFLVTGLLLWVVYWQIANGMVEVRRQQLLDEAERQKAARAAAQAAQAETAQSTMEFEA